MVEGTGKCGDQRTACGSLSFQHVGPKLAESDLAESAFTDLSPLAGHSLLEWFGVGWSQAHYVAEDDLDFPASSS